MLCQKLISSSEKKILKSKGSFKSFTPDEFSSHQRTDLSIKDGFLHVRSQNYSTPGALSNLEVTAGSMISVKINADMMPGCLAFLYVASEEGKELTKRNTILGRSGVHLPDRKEYSYLEFLGM